MDLFCRENKTTGPNTSWLSQNCPLPQGRFQVSQGWKHSSRSPGLKQSQDDFVAQLEEVIQRDDSKNICINGPVPSEACQLKDQNRKVWT